MKINQVSEIKAQILKAVLTHKGLRAFLLQNGWYVDSHFFQTLAVTFDVLGTQLERQLLRVYNTTGHYVFTFWPTSTKGLFFLNGRSCIFDCGTFLLWVQTGVMRTCGGLFALWTGRRKSKFSDHKGESVGELSILARRFHFEVKIQIQQVFLEILRTFPDGG